jgi:hypothetical protein
MVVAMKRQSTERERKKIVTTKGGRCAARQILIARKTPVLFGRLKGTGRVVGDILSTGGILGRGR